MKTNEEARNEACAELNEEELDRVSGGNALGSTAAIGSTAFMGRVDMYQGKLGQSYYIVDDDRSEWFYGQLVDTYELEYTFHTVRTHVFRVSQHNGVSCSGVKEFCGDDYTMYTSKVNLKAPSLG